MFTQRLAFRALVFLAVASAPVVAQVSDSAHLARAGRVSGIVYDSVSRKTLPGAIVQLVAKETAARVAHTAVADSIGRYSLMGLPSGQYVIGFFHPVLDSLGIEAPLRAVDVQPAIPVTADLTVPSVARLRKSYCYPFSASAPSVVVGIVRDAATREPVPGVGVSAALVELRLTREGLIRSDYHVTATTGDNGWFVLCDLPVTSSVELRAAKGRDSTDLIEVPVSTDGFGRRELFLGRHRAVIADVREMRTDSSAATLRDAGRLSGTVRSSTDHLPIRDAQVAVRNGPSTRTDEKGEWALTGVPEGSRTLDVRALGYYPLRRYVEVVPSSAPVIVSLSTLSAVLDTFRVTARGRYATFPTGFSERQRTRSGRFLTAKNVAALFALNTSDIFQRAIAGVRVGENGDGSGAKYIFMRDCQAAIYVNGLNLTDQLTTDELDIFVTPPEITGIEVYTWAETPLEYQQGMAEGGARSCGSILIWTR